MFPAMFLVPDLMGSTFLCLSGELNSSNEMGIIAEFGQLVRINDNRWRAWHL